ncbi:MAG: hypothetical protein HY319_03575 [Armatimonadetes bacterium]|nr:hypothetical protein [Armatimonadota bacterium]
MEAPGADRPGTDRRLEGGRGRGFAACFGRGKSAVDLRLEGEIGRYLLMDADLR